MARGSLAETQTYILQAHERGFLARDERERLEALCGRVRGTVTGLIRYLDTSPHGTPTRRGERRGPRTKNVR
jgi:hypothetical protein